MGVIFSIVIIVIIVIAMVYAFKNQDIQYTQGKGMFKNSKFNLNDENINDDKLDLSEYDYYNKDKMK